jgi:hypothetical protein
MVLAGLASSHDQYKGLCDQITLIEDIEKMIRDVATGIEDEE